MCSQWNGQFRLETSWEPVSSLPHGSTLCLPSTCNQNKRARCLCVNSGKRALFTLVSKDDYLHVLLLFSLSVMSESSRPHGSQHAGPPCPSPSPRVYPSSWPLHQRCHPATSSTVILFSSCLQSFPASGSFPMSRLSTSGDQGIRASALASVLPMNMQGWFPLGLTGLMSLLSKGLLRVLSSTTIQKHRVSGVQPSLWSSSHNLCDHRKDFHLQALLLLDVFFSNASRLLVPSLL